MFSYIYTYSDSKLLELVSYLKINLTNSGSTFLSKWVLGEAVIK